MREVESANQRGALEVDEGADRAAAGEQALRLALCRADEIFGGVDVGRGPKRVALHAREVEQIGDEPR